MPSQIQVVCGDLYPSKDEKRLILDAIEDYCGPPSWKLDGHWNDYRGSDGKKHLGTTTSDLQKARRDPDKFSVSTKAILGRRPARPDRDVPPAKRARAAGSSNSKKHRQRVEDLTSDDEESPRKEEELVEDGRGGMSEDDLDRKSVV